ncbi:hypothetical protein G5C51_09765 [Streptomyces sp. A7024]|uniref:Uncharacterized protein n=1 Tax=Streptomyces coryli TaxID=1128680 RepID=A0A6G4TW15_9ACTN|nr:hypothetical protein [Streptomyces coryli]NGN64189.1 hypothetical protein [Streptomyces coryli]
MAATVPTPRSTRPGSPAETRLRWWVLALPVAAFALLLALGAGGAQAASGELPLSQFLAWFQANVVSGLM